jgi:hypothetical protein
MRVALLGPLLRARGLSSRWSDLHGNGARRGIYRYGFHAGRLTRGAGGSSIIGDSCCAGGPPTGSIGVTHSFAATDSGAIEADWPPGCPESLHAGERNMIGPL